MPYIFLDVDVQQIHITTMRDIGFCFIYCYYIACKHRTRTTRKALIFTNLTIEVATLKFNLV